MAKASKVKTTPKKPRHAFLILGMHRSGTSALAGLLHHLGATLPETLMAPTEQNKRGYFESTAVQKFNDALLHSAGSSWKDWRAMPATWAKAASTAKERVNATALIKSEFPGAALPMLKDPRICRLAPFWSEALQKARYTPLFLLPFRNPAEVADSLQKRDNMPHAVGLLLWLRHVLDAEIATRGQPRIFTSFEGLLADWQTVATRISKTLNVTWPVSPDTVSTEIDTFLSADLRTVTKTMAELTNDPHLTSWIEDVYGIASHWADKGERKSDYKTLDHIRASFQDASQAFAPLIASSNQTKQALADARKSLDSTQAEITALQARLEERTNKLTEVEARDKKLQIELNETRLTHQTAEKKMAQALQKIAETENAKATAEAAQATAEAAKAEAEQQKAATEANLRSAQQAAQEIQTKYQTLAGLWEDSQGQVRGLNHNLTELQDRLKQQEQTLKSHDEAATQKLTQAKAATDVMQQTLHDNAAELKTLRDDLAQTQSALEQSRAETADTARSTHALNKEYAQAKKQLDLLNEEAGTRIRELGQLAQLLSETEKQHYTTLSEERSQMDQERAHLRQEIGSLTQEAKSLRAEMDAKDAAQADLDARVTALNDQLAGSKSWAAQLQDRTKAQERELGQIAKLLSLAESDRNRRTHALAEMELEHQKVRTEMERLAYENHTLASSTQALAEMEVEHQKLRAEMERLAYENHTLTSSTSWRITKPLRRLMGTFKRG